MATNGRKLSRTGFDLLASDPEAVRLIIGGLEEKGVQLVNDEFTIIQARTLLKDDEYGPLILARLEELRKPVDEATTTEAPTPQEGNGASAGAPAPNSDDNAQPSSSADATPVAPTKLKVRRRTTNPEDERDVTIRHLAGQVANLTDVVETQKARLQQVLAKTLPPQSGEQKKGSDHTMAVTNFMEVQAELERLAEGLRRNAREGMADRARITALQGMVDSRDARIADLERDLALMRGPAVPAPAPAPAPALAPAPRGARAIPIVGGILGDLDEIWTGRRS